MYLAHIDGPGNIFQNFQWATKYLFTFYFRNFTFSVNGVAAQNIQNSHQGDLRKSRHVEQITSTQQIQDK